MKRALTWDDVCLVPQFNNVPSRTIPDLSTWLTKNKKVGMPLVPANMDTVIGEALANTIIANGGIPIFHRFSPIDTQIALVKKYTGACFISCGLNDFENSLRVSENAIGVCIDVAHGHSDMMFNFIEAFKKVFPDKDVIAGNVCTALAYHDLVNAGADAVKVGVGPGAVCTTRMVTGFGVPQFTAIRDCAEVAEKLRIPLIADGGIRNSRDVVLALAAGASTVMVGKLFALTNESVAENRLANIEGYFRGKPVGGILMAKYRGQASEDFQNDFYGGLKDKTVAEGTSFWAPVSGSAQKLIDTLLGGLRSGLTYGGAKNIKELQRKAEFVSVTSNYMEESKPRQ